jgi:hypothetical protein
MPPVVGGFTDGDTDGDVTVTAPIRNRAISGDGSVWLPVINVVVPANLDFSLDPFMASGPGALRPASSTQISQVVESPFRIINRTGAPIAAIFYLDAVVGANVNIGGTLGDTAYDMTVSDKNIALGVIGASAFAGADYTFGDTNFTDGDATIDFNLAQPTLVLFAQTDGNVEYTADFGFVLAAATDSNGDTSLDPDTLATGNEGVASFMFYAEMQAFADWANGDVGVEGVLWVTPLLPQQVDVGGAFVATAGHNMIHADTGIAAVDEGFPPRVVTPPTLEFGATNAAIGFTHTSATAATLNRAANSATEIFIPMTALTQPGTTVVINNPAGSPWAAAGNYTLSATGVTFSTTRTTNLRTLANPSSITIVVTAGGTTTTHTLTLTGPAV